MIHADISEKGNEIVSLCGLKSGTFEWQDIFNIEFDGKLSMGISCERCRTTARFIGAGYSLTRARQIAKQQASGVGIGKQISFLEGEA